jgi:predicted O-methyltransferase YrrM
MATPKKPRKKSPLQLWTEVDRYFADQLIPPNAHLDAALAANHAAGLPSIDVSPLQGRFLELLIRISGARRVLEMGTLGGYSTIWMARALPNDGKLVTLEFSPHHAAVAQANLAAAGLSDRVEIRIGPANDSLKQLVAEGAAPFDFIFIDADKQGYPEYLEGALKLSRIGTLIVADNVVRDGKVIDPKSKDENVRGVQRFTEMLAAEPRLSATVLQTVCVKGYDGFAIAVVIGI